MTRRRLGACLTFAGNLLVIAAFFSPWFDVYKLNDPSFPFPRRRFSPWMILLGGQRGSLSIATWVFLLLIVCMAARCLAAAFSRSASGRARASIGAFGLALLSLVMMGLAVAMIPFDLSFFWPFLDSTVAYGVYLWRLPRGGGVCGHAAWTHPVVCQRSAASAPTGLAQPELFPPVSDWRLPHWIS